MVEEDGDGEMVILMVRWWRRMVDRSRTGASDWKTFKDHFEILLLGEGEAIEQFTNLVQ